MVVVALSLTADAVHATCVINTDEDCAVLVERLKAALEAIPHEEAAWIERGIPGNTIVSSGEVEAAVGVAFWESFIARAKEATEVRR